MGNFNIVLRNPGAGFNINLQDVTPRRIFYIM